MKQPSPQDLKEWYRKAATCPHNPKCRPLRSCDVAVPMDDHLSLFELGGNGGSDPDRRDLQFIQLDGDNTAYVGDHVRHTSRPETLFTESVATFGSANVADHPTAVTWARFGQAAHALPLNYRGRRGLIALSESGFVAKAAREAKMSRYALQRILERFCKEHRIDRSRLVLRNPPTRARKARA